jgi:hypothetical protein
MFCRCALVIALLGTIAASANDTKPLLRDIYGADHFYDEFIEPRTQAIVFIMLDDKCPVVKQQLPKLRELHRKYNTVQRDRAGHPVEFDKYPGDKVLFIGVYTKPSQSIKAIAEHALKASIPFRVLRDNDLGFVKKFDVKRLSEVVVFGREWNVVYQGPVDDQSLQGATKAKASIRYLEEVLDAMLAQRTPPHTRVPPVGCLIDQNPSAENPKVSYADVEPILRRRCVPCHRQDEVGPMHLTTYAEVRDYAAMVEEVISEERMPPWPVSSPRPLRNPLALDPQERELLLAWLRTNLLLGEYKAEIPVSTRAKSSRFRIANPDFVFEMPTPHTIPATGTIDYVYVPIELNGGKGFPEDRWIEAIEVSPGAPEVVHHIQVHEFHGKAVHGKVDPIEQLLHYGLSVENARLLGSYTPGNVEENARYYSSFAPRGKTGAMKLSRGANLMLEMHYTTNGKETKDRSAVAIRFAKQAPDVVIESWFPFRKRPDMVIPANTGHHSLQDRYHFGGLTQGKAVLLHGVRPHLHTRGKSYRLELISAESVSEQELFDFNAHDRIRGEVLLELPIWDFNWQHFYRFEKPIVIRADQALLATAYWDNSKFNPRNPDPSANVPWGQQTHQEMFNSLFNYEVLEPGDPRLAQSQE